MNHRQRVVDAIRHVRPDRIPKGDLAIESKLENALAAAGGFTGSDPRQRRLAALHHLNADLAHVHEYPVAAIGQDEQGRSLFRGALGEEFACGEYGLVRRGLDRSYIPFEEETPRIRGRIDFSASENL